MLIFMEKPLQYTHFYIENKSDIRMPGIHRKFDCGEIIH